MKENFDEREPQGTEGDPHKENVDALRALFAEAEEVFAAEGRDAVKPRLPGLYTKLQELNKSDVSDWKRTWMWNAEGDLTEEEFEELNLRRKALSNAIGIVTASGATRHDLNKI